MTPSGYRILQMWQYHTHGKGVKGGGVVWIVNFMEARPLGSVRRTVVERRRVCGFVTVKTVVSRGERGDAGEVGMERREGRNGVGVIFREGIVVAVWEVVEVWGHGKDIFRIDEM